MGWEWHPGLGWSEPPAELDPATPEWDSVARVGARASPSLARGLDYSAATIPGQVIRAAGYSFVIRYVDDPATVTLSRKHCRPGEYAELVAAGVDVWLVFEVRTTDMLNGLAAGVANATRARAGADALGYPPNRVIFMACDMHLTAAQIPTALGYIDGAESVLGHAATGVYGFWELVDTCIALGKGSAYWQAGIAPSASDPVHIWQRNDGFTHVGGVECDINELLRPIPSPTAPAPPVVPAPTGRLVAFAHGQFAAGTTMRHHLTCPVGPIFLCKSAWFSLSVGWEDAEVTVLFIGGRNPDGSRTYLKTLGPFPLPFDDRHAFPIPPGTEAISVLTTSNSPLGYSIELLA